MIYEYAIVDNSTDEVIGKYVSPVRPFKMQNIAYTITKPNGSTFQGKAFLSKAVKYWNVVKDPLYSANQVNTVKLGG